MAGPARGNSQKEIGRENVAGSFVDDLVLDFLKIECSGRRVEVRFFFKF
jgi:hypothetical protein